MKKVLLFAVAFMATMSANAQEIAAMTEAQATEIGLVSGSKVEVQAGTELLKTTSVTCTLLYAQTECGMTGLSANNVKVNDADFGSETGIQGNINGPGSALDGTYPESGCIYHFVPSKDGYIYVIHKGTNSKGYVVFEEKTSRPSFVFAMTDGTKVGSFDLSKIDGATFDDPTGGAYVNDGYSILTPGTTQKKDADGNKYDVPGYVTDMPSGTSVIKFQVFADLAYDVLATGSKMTLAGFVFDEDGKTTIKAGDITLLEAGTVTGIETIKSTAVVDLNSAIFNAAGQQVSKDYKGLVIKNGKKMIQK